MNWQELISAIEAIRDSDFPRPNPPRPRSRFAVSVPSSEEGARVLDTPAHDSFTRWACHKLLWNNPDRVRIFLDGVEVKPSENFLLQIARPYPGSVRSKYFQDFPDTDIGQVRLMEEPFPFVFINWRDGAIGFDVIRVLSEGIEDEAGSVEYLDEAALEFDVSDIAELRHLIFGSPIADNQATRTAQEVVEAAEISEIVPTSKGTIPQIRYNIIPHNALAHERLFIERVNHAALRMLHWDYKHEIRESLIFRFGHVSHSDLREIVREARKLVPAEYKKRGTKPVDKRRLFDRDTRKIDDRMNSD